DGRVDRDLAALRAGLGAGAQRAAEREVALCAELGAAAVAAAGAARDVDESARVHVRVSFGFRADLAAGSGAPAAGRFGHAPRLGGGARSGVELDLAGVRAPRVRLHPAALAHEVGAHAREAAVGDQLAEVHRLAARRARSRVADTEADAGGI